METGWSLQYCFTCDCQIDGGVYCSLRCRLLDLSTSFSDFELSIPVNAQTSSSERSIRQNPGKGFFLPPAFDFSAYRRCSSRPTNTLPASGCALVAPFPSNSCSISSDRITTPSRGVVPHTSILRSERISNKVRNELTSYTSSFDQVRDWRRKMFAA